MRRHSSDTLRHARGDINSIVDAIALLKANPHYRIGDIFYNKGLKHEESAHAVLTLTEFEGTILRRYLEQNGGHHNVNLPLLSAVIDAYQEENPGVRVRPDEVAVHVRAGDVVIQDWFLRTDFESLIRDAGCRNCVIVTAFSFGAFEERNWWMFSDEKLARNKQMIGDVFDRLFNSLGDDVHFRISSSTDIDEDFLTLISADNLVQDFGGFSQIAADLRKYRGMCPSMNPNKAAESKLYTMRAG
jgi:hypothetical protein